MKKAVSRSNIGNWLRRRRREMGLSQEAVSEGAEIPVRTLIRVEAGNSPISFEGLVAFCKLSGDDISTVAATLASCETQKKEK